MDGRTPGADDRAMLHQACGKALGVAILGVTTAACVAGAPAGMPPGQPASPSAPAAASLEPVEVVITASEFGFTPRRLQVPVGRRIDFRFDNRGKIDHDWLVRAVGLHLHATPGTQARASITFSAPATYAAVCSYPSHGDYGMVGDLVVAAAPDAPTGALVEATDAPAVPIPSGAARLPLPQPAPPVGRTDPRVVYVRLEPREMVGLVDDGVATTFWAFNGTVPGPMVRALEGDTVKIRLDNPIRNLESHSVDFHAATGPHGGAAATQVAPGGYGEFAFKATHPGVYVYHCGTPKAAHHVAHGLYGMIVVEPAGGLPAVDHELYVMQGELYLAGGAEARGVAPMIWDDVASERPSHVVFNGGVGAFAGDRAPRIEAGETVRIFFGNGGPNLSSSFHLIGEVFDRVYVDGSQRAAERGSVVAVPPGGAVMAELKAEVPGTYHLVDHALARTARGAVGDLIVEGAPRADLFSPGPLLPISHLHPAGDHKDHGHGEGTHDHGTMMMP